MYSTDAFSSPWFWILLMIFMVVICIFLTTLIRNEMRAVLREEMNIRKSRYQNVEGGPTNPNAGLEGWEPGYWKTPNNKTYDEYPSVEEKADLDDDRTRR